MDAYRLAMRMPFSQHLSLHPLMVGQSCRYTLLDCEIVA